MKEVVLEAFAPLQPYKVKVRDLATNKTYMYVLFDIGDMKAPDGSMRPFPLVVMDEKLMKQQMAMPLDSALLKDVQERILAHRKQAASAAEAPLNLPDMEVG